MRRSGAIILGLMLLAAPAVAAPRDELTKTRAAMEKAEQQQEKLSAERVAVAEELGALKKKLVRAAASLQQNEKELAELERELSRLSDELKLREKLLATNREKLDGLSRIAIRLSRTPPTAMVLMPGDGNKRLQAAQALAVLAKDMQAEAAKIRVQLEEISTLKSQVESKKEKVTSLKAVLKKEVDAFTLLLKERRQLHDKLAAESGKQAQEVARLAKKAASLEVLMETLSVNDSNISTKSGKMVESSGGVTGKRGSLRDFEDAKGKIRLPASGKLVNGFGDRDAAGDGSKGIKIETRSGATVVAPFDAEVAYKGPFLNYGQLVILKHRGHYHTLLAGFDRIDVNVGDFLLEGEPIGAMGEKKRRTLYIELREDNQPVDPAKWMRGL